MKYVVFKFIVAEVPVIFPDDLLNHDNVRVMSDKLTSSREIPMGNEVELKPCPFCPNGGKPWVWESRDPKANNRIVWCIACESCACEGPEAFTESEAAERWNTRASSPSSSAEIAKRIVGTVFDNTSASHETLKRVMIERIESELAATPTETGDPRVRANSFRAFLAEQMKDQEFAEAYEEISTKENELLAQIDEVSRRMDAVVDAAVLWRQSDEDWQAQADNLEAAVDSLLELRSPSLPAPPESRKP